ncbi:MAG: HEAT repeat domain-containing protein [Planctomycetes bacterium]|nr:HEAT repeat domain-containing protein [Planctomycetota bacterium]
MLEPVSTIVIYFLGAKAAEVIGSAVKDHVKGHLKKLLTSGEKKLLGKKEHDALELAYENTLTHAYSGVLDALGKVLELAGIDFPEFCYYQSSVEDFLTNRKVAEHLLESVRDLSDNALPDPQFLEEQWEFLDCDPFPTAGVWSLVAANFRKSAKEKAFITPQLREVLKAQTLDQIKALQQTLVGVQVAVQHEKYISRMLMKYAAVELANIAPSYAEDPGVLIVTDLFEPQHVRENPPPVEISKDEFEKLARTGKLDRNDEQDVIARLEEGQGTDAAQRLKFQRTSYAEQPVRPVLEVISIPPGTTASQAQRNRLLVITGEPGSGKTMLLRYLLLGVLAPPADPDDPKRPLRWTEGFIGQHEHFPLLIELRDYYFTCQQEASVNSLLDYAQHLGETQGYGIDADWLQKRLSSGPSLMLFDGLDEIFDAADRDEIMQQIVGFTVDYPQARVIVTSRPHGYREDILRPAGFAHFRLQDLDREQTASFTRAWFERVFPQSPRDAEQRIDRVLDSIKRSGSVRWLAGNPLLLTIMCLIAREKELPRERARFYEQCIDVLVHQWQINRHLEDKDLAFLDVDDKKDLLRRIAFQMQQSDAGLRGNFIAERELLAITQDWFEENFEDYKGAKAKSAAKQMVKGLWERNYLICPRGPKLYGFLHRTFMEYLTATEYVRRFEKTEEFTLDDLDTVFREHGNEPEWSEVLRLICGEVGDEFADTLIRTLLTLKEFPTESLTEENQPNHLVLAIRCMSELRGLSKMDELGAFALRTCTEFLDVVVPMNLAHPFMVSEFLDAVGDVRDRWPRRSDLKRLAPKDSGGSGRGAAFYPQFEAILLGDRARSINYVTNQHWLVRYNALTSLFNEWADDRTRQLLSQRAVEDKNSSIRAKALELLAGHEPWADETTRQLLSQRAVEDEDEDVRVKALELLAGHEPWATHDETLAVRRRFLDEYVRGAAEAEERGKAACAWIGSGGSSDPLSDAKKLVFSKDMDGIAPYLDPRTPVADEHLAKVAKEAGLSEDRIDEMVEQMSETLGWDIRAGLGPIADDE